MSKGPGRIQLAISAVFAAEPDNAFTTTELCERIYHVVPQFSPDDECDWIENDDRDWVEKKHRIAVVRAAKKIARLDWFASETLGGQLVFFDPLNVMSYAMARLKGDNFGGYHNNDRRRRWRQETEAQLRARLVEGGDHYKYVVKDGSWWRKVEIERAKARGDHKRAAQLQVIEDAERLFEFLGAGGFGHKRDQRDAGSDLGRFGS
jgi:hypothetical protein